MKDPRNLRSSLLATAWLTCLAASPASSAATLYWDGNDTTADADGGAGTWDATATNWDDAATAGNPVAWTALDDAIFGGTAGTVTVSGTHQVSSLEFGVDGYTITGGTLTLAGTLPGVTVGDISHSAIIQSVLAGTDGFTKSGSGTLTVSNAGNGYTGATNVGAGLLVFNQTANYVQAISASSLLTVSSGAEVRITGGVNAFQRSAGDAAVILDGGTFDYQASTHGHMGNITLSNGATWKASAGGGYNGENMQLNGTVTVAGTSASTISNFSQGLGLSGNREFNVADVTTDTGVDLTVAAELENNDGGAGDGIIKTGAGTMNLTSASTYSGSTVVNGGTLRISNALRSTSGITVSNGATLETNATNIFVGGHSAAVADSMVVTLNGSNWVMTSAHDARIGNVVLNDASTWTSNRGTAGYDVLLANTTAGAATVAVTGTGASVMNGTGGIHLQGIQNFNVADTTGDAAADLSVSLVLAAQGSTGGAAGGINKLGAGTMAISRQTSYTGGTTVSEGVLDLTGGGGSGGTIRGTATVNSGATLRLSTGDATGYATDATRLAIINLVGGTMDVNSTSNQTLGSAVINMTGGTITGIAGSNLDFFGGASALNTLASADTSVIGGVALSPLRQGSTTFNVADGDAAVDLRIDSVLRNSPSGNAGGSVLIKAGDGTMELTANNTLTNGLTINGGVVAITANGLYRNANGTAAYNTGAVVTINTGGTLRLQSFSYNGDGGLGGLRDYAGNRVINGGTLEVVGAGHSSGNDFTVGAAGGTFRYAPANSADTLTLAGNSNTNTQLNGALDFDTVGNISVTGSIDGTGSIIKSGGGTLTLAAANSYSGTTTVNEGTLFINNSSGSGTGSGSVNVTSSGTLGGTGIIAGSTTVDGTLAPGASAGTLSFTSDLGLNASAILSFEFNPLDPTAGGGINDLLAVTGSFTLDGLLNVIATSGDFLSASPGDSWTIATYTGSLVDNGLEFGSMPALAGGYNWSIDTSNSGFVNLAVIPEPRLTLLGSLGLLLILRRRRDA